MDVGLNNRNTLGDVSPEFTDVVFFVEATSCETLSLWSEYSKQSLSNYKSLDDSVIDSLSGETKVLVKALNDKVRGSERNRIEWKQVMAGFGLTIGYIKKLPVTLCFTFAILNGKKVCFYECTSRLADHTMIEKWLIKHFQLTHDNYTRWNHTNAMNFHKCVRSLDNLDVEPRDTIYKG